MHEAAERLPESGEEPDPDREGGEPVAAAQRHAAIAQGLVRTQSAGDGDRMVEALTAAIARLRANVEAVGESPVPRSEAIARPGHAARVQDNAVSGTETVRPRPAHKHSRSWIARWRIKRKQRKSA
jgi:hypothetical protein